MYGYVLMCTLRIHLSPHVYTCVCTNMAFVVERMEAVVISGISVFSRIFTRYGTLIWYRNIGIEYCTFWCIK